MVFFDRGALLIAGCVFCGVFGGLPMADAAGVGQTGAGLPYYIGGVTSQEPKDVALRRPRHNFVLQVVSGLSGGPIADAEAKISDASGKLLLGVAMDGPWLLITLEPGRYRVAVRFQDEVMHRDVEIAAKGQSELTLGFRSSPEVSLLLQR